MPVSSRMNPESKLLACVYPEDGIFRISIVDQDDLETRPLLEGRAIPKGEMGLVNLGWVVSSLAEFHHLPHEIRELKYGY